MFEISSEHVQKNILLSYYSLEGRGEWILACLDWLFWEEQVRENRHFCSRSDVDSKSSGSWASSTWQDNASRWQKRIEVRLIEYHPNHQILKHIFDVFFFGLAFAGDEDSVAD